MILLLIVEAARETVVPRVAVTVLVLAAGISVIANVGALGQGAGYLRESSGKVAAEVGAVEFAGPKVPPAFIPDLIRVSGVSAGPYLEAVGELGSPGYTPEALASKPDSARQAADVVLVRVATFPDNLPSTLTDGAAAAARQAPPPAIDAAAGVDVRAEGSCQLIRPSDVVLPAVKPFVQLSVPTAGLTVAVLGDAPLVLLARRFATVFPERPLATIAGRSAATIRLPLGRAAAPWHLEFEPSTRVRVCALG